MPGGSSAAKEEPTKVSSPPPLLGAAGSTGKDDHIDGPVMEPPRVSPAPTPVAEGARPREKYSLYISLYLHRP